MANSIVFSGNSNPALSKIIQEKLCNVSAPTKFEIGRADITTFSDGEIRVEIKQTVRGKKAYVIQSTCSPVNDRLIEMLIIADALRRSAVNRIVAVIPYFGYARQDRRPGYNRTPITARLVADMLQQAGYNHIITIDIHATQIQGFFSIPVDNISATQLFVADIYSRWGDENPIIVSPDAGGVARAKEVAKHFDQMDLAIIDKRRPKANISHVMNIIGDVRNKTCIIIDDMVDTAGTLSKAADALIDLGGAKRVVAYATHGVLSGNARENIRNSKLEELVITDSIPVPSSFDKTRIISIGSILAETISRINNKQSISMILE